MTQFKPNRPNNDIRLRKWEPGRVAQLKLFVSHLEQTVNNSLAAQVVQSAKRKFSEFVPKVPIQDISIEVEFRELRVDLIPPKGLKRFLFYEWQLSTFSNFASFQRFISPEPHFVFSSVADGATNFIRVRVVTTDGLVGPFSDSVTGTTPRARSIQTFDGSFFETRLFDIETNRELWTIEHESIGGNAVYYTVEYQVETSRVNASTGWADIALQWKVDGDQVGQDMLVTTLASNDHDISVTTTDIGDPPGDLEILAPYDFIKRGTLVQKVSTLTEGVHTISMEGRILRDATFRPNDFIFASTVLRERPTSISFRNFSLFEVITTA